MSAQKPMAMRMQEMLELIWKYDRVSVHRLDKKVLKRLIKQGKAKIVSVGGYRIGVGRTSRSMVTATIPAPTNEVPETKGPYSKRRADTEAMGISYRGKNWGKKRIDLPREERERKINEKRLFWAKLKHVSGNIYPK